MDSPGSTDEEWGSKPDTQWSKLDRVSVTAAVLGGGGVLAIAASFSDWDMLLPYILVALLTALVAAPVLWVVRLFVFGRLGADVDPYVPVRIRRLAAYWFVSKIGLVFASIYLFMAAGAGLVLGWTVDFLVEGAVLLVLAMMIGDCILLCIRNIALIRFRSGGRAKTNTNI